MKHFIFIPVIFILSSCGFIKGSTNPAIDEGIKFVEEIYPEDNWIEEDIEDIIEDLTGIEIDLSPNGKGL